MTARAPQPLLSEAMHVPSVEVCHIDKLGSESECLLHLLQATAELQLDDEQRKAKAKENEMRKRIKDLQARLDDLKDFARRKVSNVFHSPHSMRLRSPY
jgi:hypothetical protein